jgi:hypothetical protein
MTSEPALERCIIERTPAAEGGRRLRITIIGTFSCGRSKLSSSS